jgi:hypothetical protein
MHHPVKRLRSAQPSARRQLINAEVKTATTLELRMHPMRYGSRKSEAIQSKSAAIAVWRKDHKATDEGATSLRHRFARLPTKGGRSGAALIDSTGIVESTRQEGRSSQTRPPTCQNVHNPRQLRQVAGRSGVFKMSSTMNSTRGSGAS